MIKKYVYGEPFETEALTETLETAEGKPGYEIGRASCRERV